MLPGCINVPYALQPPTTLTHNPASPCSALGPLLVSKEYSAPSTTNLPYVAAAVRTWF